MNFSSSRNVLKFVIDSFCLTIRFKLHLRNIFLLFCKFQKIISNVKINVVTLD